MTAWRELTRALRRGPASEPAAPAPDSIVSALTARLDAAAQRRLGRSLALRHVGGGGCNGCEVELQALQGVLYDLERFGLRFVASPRHADVLVVTGPLTRNLREALERTWAAMPDPKWVVALGGCAIDGGLFRGGYAVLGGVGEAVPVDLTIPGCPPAPAMILAGLRTLIEANA